MKKFTFLLLGLLIGFIVAYFWVNKSIEDKFYIQLPNNYCIDGMGTVKKGTLVKFDQAYSEGFSRYILYLNISSKLSGEKYDNSEREDEIIPYWLNPLDSTCIDL